MNTFIIPLRSEKSTKHWDLVSEACLKTLASIRHQSNKNFNCVLVCHELPLNFKTFDGLEVVYATFEAPTESSGFKKDKGRKVALGMSKLQEYNTKWFMVVDADDILHSNLNDYILSNKDQNDLVVENGYVWNGGSLLRHHKTGFYKLCGTCYIGASSHFDEGLDFMREGHHRIKTNLNKNDICFNAIPFPAVIKNVSYGENISKTYFVFSKSILRTLKKLLQLRLLNKRIRSEFNFDKKL